MCPTWAKARRGLATTSRVTPCGSLASLSEVMTTLALVTAKALAYLASLNSEMSPASALSSAATSRSFRSGAPFSGFGADARGDLGQGKRPGPLIKSVVGHGSAVQALDACGLHWSGAAQCKSPQFRHWRFRKLRWPQTQAFSAASSLRAASARFLETDAALAGSLVNSRGSDRALSSLAISAVRSAIWCSAGVHLVLQRLQVLALLGIAAAGFFLARLRLRAAALRLGASARCRR